MQHIIPEKCWPIWKGMTISSVDVFVEDASEYSSIVIYGEKSQLTNGN
ncbi:MAG: hypothetical protein ACLSG8_06475 [Barnesiella sp.]